MKIKRILFFLAFFILLVSCKNEKNDVVEMSEIIPQAKREYNGKDSTSANKPDTMKEFKNALGLCHFTFDNYTGFEETMFPDRFEPLRTERIALIKQNDTTKFYRWTYKDSVQTMNAFYNWLDHFGKNKNQIMIAEERNFQRKAFQLFIGDTTMIFIQGDSGVDFKNWLNCLDSLGYNPEWNYLIEQNIGGKAKWFTFTEEMKTKIVNQP